MCRVDAPHIFPEMAGDTDIVLTDVLFSDGKEGVMYCPPLSHSNRQKYKKTNPTTHHTTVAPPYP